MTVRTVRHYHAEGLLPVPPARGAWRDYGLEHVARVGRIRWLVEAGMSLSAVRDALDGSSVVQDLEATLAAVELQQLALERQRTRLQVLLASAGSGRSLTPMPAVVVDHYDRMEAEAPDDRTARAVRAERDFAELAWYRGEMPDGVELLYVQLDAAGTQEALRAYGRDLGELGEAELEAAAAATVARMLVGLGDSLAAMADGLTHLDLDRVYDLYAATADPGQRRLGELVRTKLHAALDEERAR